MNAQTVIVPVADMRGEPDHRSERVSQALFGHDVEVTQESNSFMRVKSADDYLGWIASAYMIDATASGSRASVVTSHLAVFKGGDGGRLCLPYGARIESASGFRFRAPDGNEWRLSFGRISVDDAISLSEALLEAQSLISVPYLWGGSSSFGYDCSGFTQAIYRRCGVILPRDSKDQAQIGREVRSDEIIPGDLIFFPGHVAVALGDSLILHSSRLRAGVQIDSLDSRHPRYRADLAGAVTTVRRIL